MRLKERVYLIISRLFPLRYKIYLKQLNVYAGEPFDVDLYLGSATILAFLACVVTLLVPYALANRLNVQFILFAVIAFVLVEAVAYLVIYFKAEDRTKRVEEILPDALQLIGANVRAGMTPYQALKRAARKEFGPLEEEINRATARALGTESFSQLLLDISKRIRSEILERAMELFATSMKSGGRLAKLLEELAHDVEETRSLKRELVTSTKTYIAFIMFTIVIGAPLLLAISIQFVKIITGMQARSGVTDVGFGLGFLAGQIAITPDFLIKLSIWMLIITGLLASMLLGAIAEGKPTYGFRYSPVIVIGSLVVFAVFRYVIGNFFGGLL